MITKRIIPVVLLAVVIIFSGCAEKEYDFSDAGIIAYVDGEPICLCDKDDFILIKTAYCKAYESEYQGLEKVVEPVVMTYDVFQKLLETMKPFSLVHWEGYEGYSDKEKEQDYITTIMRMYVYLSQLDDEEKREFIELNESAFVSLNSSIYLGTKMEYEFDDYMIDAITEIADVKGVSYDECVVKVYKPFWMTLVYYSYFTDEFMEDYYSGEDYNNMDVDEDILKSDDKQEISQHLAEVWVSTKNDNAIYYDLCKQYDEYAYEKYDDVEIVWRKN